MVVAPKNTPDDDEVNAALEKIQSLAIDLTGLLASTVVFTQRATLHTHEVTNLVLEAIPTLRETIIRLYALGQGF